MSWAASTTAERFRSASITRSPACRAAATMSSWVRFRFATASSAIRWMVGSMLCPFHRPEDLGHLPEGQAAIGVGGLLALEGEVDLHLVDRAPDLPGDQILEPANLERDGGPAIRDVGYRPACAFSCGQSPHLVQGPRGASGGPRVHARDPLPVSRETSLYPTSVCECPLAPFCQNRSSRPPVLCCWPSPFRTKTPQGPRVQYPRSNRSTRERLRGARCLMP